MNTTSAPVDPALQDLLLDAAIELRASELPSLADAVDLARCTLFCPQPPAANPSQLSLITLMEVP